MLKSSYRTLIFFLLLIPTLLGAQSDLHFNTGQALNGVYGLQLERAFGPRKRNWSYLGGVAYQYFNQSARSRKGWFSPAREFYQRRGAQLQLGMRAYTRSKGGLYGLYAGPYGTAGFHRGREIGQRYWVSRYSIGLELGVKARIGRCSLAYGLRLNQAYTNRSNEPLTDPSCLLCADFQYSDMWFVLAIGYRLVKIEN